MTLNRRIKSSVTPVIALAALMVPTSFAGCASADQEPPKQVDIEKSRQEHIDVSKREQASEK
jgi:hypothetical protein